MARISIDEKSKKIMTKFAFIVRGVPGSGKSTTAQYLAGDVGIVHAVDDLHIDEKGCFRWNDDRVEEYYQQNFDAFAKSCQTGVSVVVCDNINVTQAEYQKYVECAHAHGYITSVVSLKKLTPAEATQRNQHGVSITQIMDMYERWED